MLKRLHLQIKQCAQQVMEKFNPLLLRSMNSIACSLNVSLTYTITTTPFYATTYSILKQSEHISCAKG